MRCFRGYFQDTGSGCHFSYNHPLVTLRCFYSYCTTPSPASSLSPFERTLLRCSLRRLLLCLCDRSTPPSSSSRGLDLLRLLRLGVCGPFPSRDTAMPALSRILSTTGPISNALSPRSWLQQGLHFSGNMQSHHFSPITDLKLPQGPRSHGFSPGLLWSIANVRGGDDGTGSPLVFREGRRGCAVSGYVIV